MFLQHYNNNIGKHFWNETGSADSSSPPDVKKFGNQYSWGNSGQQVAWPIFSSSGNQSNG